jgi:acyl carrier protein
MKQLISEEKVIGAVKKAIVETLGIEEDSITPESSLMKDLGAESLDFLDINYRLEQAFGIKMARHSLIEHIEDMFGEDSAIDANGQLTEQAVKLLAIRFGDTLPGHAGGLDMDEVPNIITVQSMANAVLDILLSLPEQCPACGKSAWTTDAETRIRCGSCGEPGSLANGDELVRKWLTQVQEEKHIF